jgi:hypothetical protein
LTIREQLPHRFGFGQVEHQGISIEEHNRARCPPTTAVTDRRRSPQSRAFAYQKRRQQNTLAHCPVQQLPKATSDLRAHVEPFDKLHNRSIQVRQAHFWAVRP